MPLTLVPTFNEMTRQEIEERLSVIRVKRMAVAIQFQQGLQQKLHGEYNKTATKLIAATNRLEKNLQKLDDLLEKCKDDLARCSTLHHQMTQTVDLIEIRDGDDE